MKRRYLLLAGVGVCAISGGALAFECAVPPTCEELGYTMTEADCSDKATLKCPFDYTKMFCVSSTDPSAPITCSVGDILYDDYNCYLIAPSGKTAIGVVFDTSKRLAIALELKSRLPWHSYGTDITSMTNCTESKYNHCDTDGQVNTDRIIAFSGSENDYPAGYCRSKGEEWFLPSASELETLFYNKTAVNDGLSKAGGTAITAELDYMYDYYWSSTEASSLDVWQLRLPDGKMVDYSKDGRFTSTRCAVAY